MTIIRTPHAQPKPMKGMIVVIAALALLALFFRIIGLIT